MVGLVPSGLVPRIVVVLMATPSSTGLSFVFVVPVCWNFMMPKECLVSIACVLAAIRS